MITIAAVFEEGFRFERSQQAALSPHLPVALCDDISVLDNVGPVRYSRRKTANTDAALIQKASRFSKKLLRRESGVSQHAIDRFFDGERIHPATRKKLAETVDKLERRC